MSAKHTFSEEEKAQVKQAVKDLEKVSCGEMVPYFVSSSDEYSETSWFFSAIMASVTSLIIGILSYNWLLPVRITPFEISILILGSLILGFVMPLLFPTLKRRLTSSEKLDRRVNQRATEAFLNEGVFNTEERVGILIFVSKLEHKVLVLGDEGINSKVQQEDWDHIVATIVEGIKANQIADGLVKAIDQCKELLLKHGFVRKSSDFNELDDDLRVED